MTKITDDMLMAYVDGELSPQQRAQVEAFLQSNPDAQQKMSLFQATGKNLGTVYSDLLEQPVPSHLVDLIRTKETKQTKQSISASQTSFKETLLNAVYSLLSPVPAFALITAFVGGAILHAVMMSSPDQSASLLAPQNGKMYAASVLHDVLERSPSEESRNWQSAGGEQGFIVSLNSFKNKDNRFCREYEIAVPQKTSSLGVACREQDGQWVVQFHADHKPAPQNTQDFKPASGPALISINDFIKETMAGSPLDSEMEAKAISGGWK